MDQEEDGQLKAQKFSDMKTIRTDVLVIGAGAAGIRAALAASEVGVEVLLLAKSEVTRSGSTFSTLSNGWGIQALLGKERTGKNLEDFYDDIMRVGLGRCDPKLVRVLVEESGQRLEDLISYGMRFKKDSTGSYVRAKGCFSDCNRAFLTEDMGNVKKSFLSMLRRSGVKMITGYALDLITADESCWGAWVLTNANEMVRVNAKATVLATGGGAGIFSDHLVSNKDVGDGYALAHGVGAELNNMEFIQFMLGLKKDGSRLFLPLNDLRIPGILKDEKGRDPLVTHIPDGNVRAAAVHCRQKHFPFSCRDSSWQVDMAVAKELGQGSKIFLEKDRGTKGSPEVMHFSHAFNGGIRIDEKAESTLRNLFAAGEVASGPHGADRLGGCMMTATQVFGKRAGQFGAQRAQALSKVSFPDIRPDVQIEWTMSASRICKRYPVGEIELVAKNALEKYAMALRWEEGLKRCFEKLCHCKSSLEDMRSKGMIPPIHYWKIRNLIVTGKLVVERARLRKHSLGSHFRKDFPPPVSSPVSHQQHHSRQI